MTTKARLQIFLFICISFGRKTPVKSEHDAGRVSRTTKELRALAEQGRAAASMSNFGEGFFSEKANSVV
jgi:hypothetical protein